MQFLAATCPKCSGALQIPAELSVVKCMYCGVDVVTKEASSGPSVANLLEVAEAAFVSGNYREAFDRYGEALALDPTNAKAWLNKGFSAGWQSKVDGDRVPEMMTLVAKAVTAAPETEKKALRVEGARGINAVCVALNNLVQKRLAEYVALDNTWGEHLATCRVLFAGYEAAHALDPENKVVMENIVLLATDCLGGVEYRDIYHSKSILRHMVSGQRAEELRAIVGRYTVKIRKLDPVYSAPVPAKPDESSGARTFGMLALGALILFCIIFVAVKCNS